MIYLARVIELACTGPGVSLAIDVEGILMTLGGGGMMGVNAGEIRIYHYSGGYGMVIVGETSATMLEGAMIVVCGED